MQKKKMKVLYSSRSRSGSYIGGSTYTTTPKISMKENGWNPWASILVMPSKCISKKTASASHLLHKLQWSVNQVINTQAASEV